MSKTSNDGAIAGGIALVVMAVCCGAPVLLGALAIGAPAVLAVGGWPWFLVALAALIGVAVVAVIVRRRRRTASCDVANGAEGIWHRRAS